MAKTAAAPASAKTPNENLPQRYRLKPECGKHQRPPRQIGDRKGVDRLGNITTEPVFGPPEVVRPGDIFEPTAAELRAFCHKFEKVDESGNPLRPEAVDTFFDDVKRMNRNQLKRT